MRTSYLSKIAAAATIFLSVAVHAEQNSKFALPLSASVGLGTMESGDMNLQSRTMSVLSIEALPSYRIDKWLIGPHLDYRWQGQVTSLSDAGETNLKGTGWLLGLGVRHDFNEKFFVQGAVDFAGFYDLTRDTVANEDDNLKSPLSVRVKTGYAFLERSPNLTFDADLQLLQYKTIHIAGVDRDATFKQLMVSVGLTYQFGFGKSQSQTTPAPTAEIIPVSKNDLQQEEIAKVLETEKTSTGYKVNLPSAAFASSKADLSPAFKAKIHEVGSTLAKNPNQKMTIKGHTDSSGRVTSNNKLSLSRANHVKAALVESGVSAANITTIGVGSQEPIADNKTSEGRTQNRRVEILIQGEANEN